MKELLIRYEIIYVILAAFLAARPWLSRKNVLFGVVFGSAEIWNQEITRKIVKRFVVVCLAIAVLLASAFLLIYHYTSLNEMELTHFYSATVFGLILLDMIPYIWANFSMKKSKATFENGNLVKDKITVEVGGTNLKNNRPISFGWYLLLLVPIAITVIVAVLYYPGQSINLIVGPIFSQIVLAAIMFLIGIFSQSAPTSVRGNPGAAPGYAAFRRFLSLIIIAVTLVLEIKFLLTELVYLGIIGDLHSETSVITALMIFLVILLFAGFLRMARYKKLSGAVLDDDDKWILGMIYFNPSDSSLFVEKRNGIGRTVNFGRPAAWVILAVVILLIIFKTLVK